MPTPTPRFTWRDAPDLMLRLTTAQNSPRLSSVDVMSFASWCDDRAELERHVVYCEARARRNHAAEG